MRGRNREHKTKPIKSNVIIEFMKKETPYHNLRINLYINGYKCKSEEFDFTFVNDHVYGKFENGKIYADNKKCFDKWSRCPIIVNLPTDRKKLTKLFKKLEWLQTKEGYDASNDYDFDQGWTEE